MLKKIIAALLAIAMVISVASLCACASNDIGKMTTAEVVKDMGIGINLGNTFDSTGEWFEKTVTNQETAWGSPVITEKMIKGYAEGGIGVVRLPVSWTLLMDDKGNVSKKLLDRIEEVVGWITDSGMYCILNTHHDGWDEKFQKDKSSAMKLYENMWKQICKRFKNHNEKLIFESMNEVGFDKMWNQYGGTNGKDEAFRLFNKINQKFVDIVRASGGNNEKRHLLIASYWTNIGHACDRLFEMPEDPANSCALSVHYYTPSTFCILSEDADWGKAQTEWGSKQDYSLLESEFDKLKTNFVDKGIPVIVGEYGCTTSNKTREVVELWLGETTEAALSRDICPILWDTPGGAYDRNKAEFSHPEFLKKMIALKDKYK